MKNNKNLKILAALASTLAITACTSVPEDGGVSAVYATFNDRIDSAYRLPRLGEPLPMSPEEVSVFLQEPLSLADIAAKASARSQTGAISDRPARAGI